jgi:hypothetical protein
MSTMKRLVDLVDRGLLDDEFSPSTTNNTIFHREWPRYHNATTDVVEVAYQGNATWGQRIMIPLTRYAMGDMLQWLCLRFKPLTWLPGFVNANVSAGVWNYLYPEQAWMWASSLGSVAIQQVEFQIGDTTIETIPGEFLDIWSRQWMDGGRAGVWDLDIYGQLSPNQIRNTGAAPWTTLQPTEDGYVYSWIPLSFLKRPTSAFPLIAIEQQEVRVIITMRPFTEVIRKRASPRVSPTESPLGSKITFVDVTGSFGDPPPDPIPTAIPYDIDISEIIPTFEDATVFAGVVHLEDPLRSAYLRDPFEVMYEPVKYTTFDIPDRVVGLSGNVLMQLKLTELTGPIREICWFIRRKYVWDYNEWTNYGALLEDELSQSSISAGGGSFASIPLQQPLMVSARILVDNAVWADELEDIYRIEYGLHHRGGVRISNGMVYGYVFGNAAGWDVQDIQPAGTVNASRSTIRLDLTIKPPSIPAFYNAENPVEGAQGWVVHVFGIGINWMRFVNGRAGPLFSAI